MTFVSFNTVKILYLYTGTRSKCNCQVESSCAHMVNTQSTQECFSRAEQEISSPPPPPPPLPHTHKVHLVKLTYTHIKKYIFSDYETAHNAFIVPRLLAQHNAHMYHFFKIQVITALAKEFMFSVVFVSLRVFLSYNITEKKLLTDCNEILWRDPGW